MRRGQRQVSSCSACLANTPYCAACRQRQQLPLISRDGLRTLRPTQGRRQGFGLFDAIYVLTTASSWSRSGNETVAHFRGARVGPIVHVVNGTALDEAHSVQLSLKSGEGRHLLAVSWSHAAVARHALASGFDPILVVEDDVWFLVNASATLDGILRSLPPTWRCLRLGYSYRRARHCTFDQTHGVAAVRGRDVRSSVAVAYHGGGIALVANQTFYNFYNPSVMAIDTRLSRLFIEEHLALPPLATQASKLNHLATAYGLLSICCNVSVSQARIYALDRYQIGFKSEHRLGSRWTLGVGRPVFPGVQDSNDEM